MWSEQQAKKEEALDERGGQKHWVGKIPWRRAWQPTPVFLPGKSQGQRSPAGSGSWGCTGSDTTEHTHHARKCCRSTWPWGLSEDGVLCEWWCHSSTSDSCGGQCWLHLELAEPADWLVNYLPACLQSSARPELKIKIWESPHTGSR